MRAHRILSALSLALVVGTSAQAQNTLKDGTSLQWDRQITVGQVPLKTDSAEYPALAVQVYEVDGSQVWSLLKKELPGAEFKKSGKLMKAPGVSIGTGMATPVDLLASVTENKKERVSTLVLAPLVAGTTNPATDAALEPAVRELAVKLNKAVVQQQLDQWTKQLGKADNKAEGAAADKDKAQERVNKAQAELEKVTKEKSKLQNQHAVLQKEIDLHNQKWTLSQDPKDLKKLTKARSKITKNESQMAKVMAKEAKIQTELTKSSSNLPDAQKKQEEKAASQADVQRTVDALKRKLESIR